MQQQEVKRLADKLAKDCDYSLLDLSKVIHSALVESNFHEEAVRLEHYFNARFNDRASEAEAVDYLKSQHCIVDCHLPGDIVNNAKNEGYELTLDQAEKVADATNETLKTEWSSGIQWEAIQAEIETVLGE